MSILHLSLGSKKAKDVSTLLANDTARRIMDAVADESKSETKIAKELSIPLSTVHYNIGRLQDAGLVVSDEFTYSEKGKEVRHYKLASEHVVITAKPIANLASLLTGLGLSIAVAATFFINSNLFGVTQNSAPKIAEMAAYDAVQEESTRLMAASAPMPMPADPVVWPYILLGAAAMLIGIGLWRLIERYR